MVHLTTVTASQTCHFDVAFYYIFKVTIEHVCSSDKVWDLYSHRPDFESRPGHWYPSRRSFCFFSSCRPCLLILCNSSFANPTIVSYVISNSAIEYTINKQISKSALCSISYYPKINFGLFYLTPNINRTFLAIVINFYLFMLMFSICSIFLQNSYYFVSDSVFADLLAFF
jgi:hypothetical protein